MRWAIVALVPTTYREYTTKRNEYLVQFLHKYRSNNRTVDVLMFSEFNLSSSLWEHQFQGLAKYYEINIAHLGYSSKRKEQYGYKFMCKFFMIDMYEYLLDYDFYMRLDTDCFLINADHNLFAWAEETPNFQYSWTGYAAESHLPTKETLYPWIVNYTRDFNVSPLSLLGFNLSTPLTFYNNFHIAKIRFFRRLDVRNFLLGTKAPIFVTARILSLMTL